MMYGTNSPYLDLQVMEELHLQDALYSRPKFYGEKQGDRWKDRLRQRHMEICKFYL